MRRWLQMRDYLTVRSRDIVDYTKATDSTDDLLVHVAATHSGIVNGNRRFYRPDRMADSVHTWHPTKGGFAKPVLVKHDKAGDPLGRVLEAKYIDESYKYKNEHTNLRDSIFYCTDAKKKVDVFRSIDWIVDNLMSNPDYTGLGYIDLGLRITNPEAVRKVLADEYLTVSVGMKTDAAICSICHSDWADEGAKCEHELGEMYDHRPMFIITGNFIYEECSFVNFPADPYAGVVSKKTLADSLEKMFFLGLPVHQQQALPHSRVVRMADAYGLDIEIVEGEMPQSITDEKTAAELAALTDGVSKEEKEATREQLDAELAASSCALGDEAPEDWTKFEMSAEDKVFFGQGEDALYAEICKEIDAALTAGELKDEEVKDAKLSSEARGKLKTGTFCGPGRSFPVPDCAHVTAARRLIGRAKVSDSTKSKILACVSRKASSMSCGGKGKDEQVVPGNDPVICDEIKALGETAGLKLADEDKSAASVAANCLNHYQGLNHSYVKADDGLKYKISSMHRALGEHWNTNDMLDYYKKRLSEHKDFVVLTKAEHDELTGAKAQSQNEINTLRDQAMAVLANYKRGLAHTIVLHKVMSGADGFKELKPDQVQEKVGELAKRSVSSLKDSVTDILSELKWVVPAAAPAADKSKETEARTIQDNAKVTEPTVPAATAATDQAKAQRDAELLQARLAAMTPRERTIHLADLLYKPAASKQSK